MQQMFCLAPAPSATPQSSKASCRFDLPSDCRLLSRQIKRPQQPILRLDDRCTWHKSHDLSLDAQELRRTPRRRWFCNNSLVDYSKRIFKLAGSRQSFRQFARESTGEDLMLIRVQSFQKAAQAVDARFQCAPVDPDLPFEPATARLIERQGMPFRVSSKSFDDFLRTKPIADFNENGRGIR